MYEVAIEILNKIYIEGYEAYIIGGFVRDKLLNNISSDIDITTNAKPSDLLKIFEDIDINNEYASCTLKYKNYIFEITTYRKDYYLENVRWPEIQYVSTLNEDLKRRDFSINCIAIDKDENYIDLIGGIEDINDKIIRCIGDPINKIKEDPLRILRAIRFMCTLDFNIDDNLLKAIKSNINLLDNLSYDRKKEELNYIFKSHYLNKYIKLIEELDLFKKLEIKLKNDIILCDNELGMWAQIQFSDNYNFSKKDKKIINEVKYILNEKIIDSYMIYKFSIDSIKISSQILNLDVEELIKNLKIKTRNDININYNDLRLFFKDNEINEIYVELEKEILYNRLENKKDSIMQYLINKVGD